MEYREIDAVNIDEAKFKIKKEFGDRARIIKVVESSKGGFLGLGRKKQVRVLISISEMDLLKKYRENIPFLLQFAQSADIQSTISPIKEFEYMTLHILKFKNIGDLTKKDIEYDLLKL